MFLSGALRIVAFGLLLAVPACAQVNTCGSTKLACLLPFALHTNPPTFNFFNQTFATQIGQLPLATPASGFLFTFDRQNGVYHASQESFGPMVAERIETIGRRRVYIAFTFQRFQFDELDGNNLGALKIVFRYPNSTNPTVVTQTSNRVDSKLNQYVVFGTYGLSSKVDVSLAIPINRVSLGLSTSGTEYSTNSSAQVSFNETVAGEASGFGDLVLAGKGTVYKSDRYGAAVGMEIRLPTGDDQNFLGSGAVGFKPYVAFARRGRVAPHLNLLYQWNSSSALNKDLNGSQRPLPGYFGYTFGADMGLLHWLTVDADLVGQHFFNAPRITTAKKDSAVGVQAALSSVGAFNGDYDVDNLAVGVKLNPWRKLLLIGNATVKLNDGGMRATVVPLVGLSYSF